MKVSVCIATYNGAQFIKQQLDSILDQLSLDDEVIVSDDSSTDNTVELIESYRDARIKVFRNQHFRNPIFNFEFAIKQASNEIIFLSDQDDIWKRGKVDEMKEILQIYDVVVSDHSLIDDRGNILEPSYFRIRPYSSVFIPNLMKNSYFGCCMAFKRRVLRKALPFPKDIPMHDIWLGFVCTIYYKTFFLDKPYTLYRKHDRNVTTAHRLKSGTSIVKKIKYRINLLKYLPRLIVR